MRNSSRPSTCAGQVRTLLDEGAAGLLADGELLERFAARSGEPAEAAFAALVDRHGPMVLRACRSILRDPHRAEDAFQATFLLLARRAGSLWVRDSLGPWLHSVACRVASGSRAAEGRRSTLERRAASRASRSTVHEPARDELDAALHEEIERLPERLRAPVVLCYLEGLTHDQAADHLACPLGTVRSRLARGRDRLRRGLTRRGFAPPQAEPTRSPTAVLSPTLAALATRAARLASDRATVGPLARWSISLAERILRAMTIHPLKSAAALLLATGVVAAGLGATSGQEPKKEEASRAVPPTAPQAERPADARFEALAAESRSLRLRVEELERRLETFESAGKPSRPAGLDPRTLRKVRPWFENTRVEKALVSAGQAVKKGDPILEILSLDLAAAKNDFRFKFAQWLRDEKFLKAREPLAKDSRITQIVWVETQTAERKSRLDYLVAQEKLIVLGMDRSQIRKLLDGLRDDSDPALSPRVEDLDYVKDIAGMTLTAPVDGTVVEIVAEPGNFYGPRDILLIIAPAKP